MTDYTPNPDSDEEAPVDGYESSFKGVIEAVLDSAGGGGTGLTDTQLRADPVETYIIDPLTGLPYADDPVEVTGPLTNAQLEALVGVEYETVAASQSAQILGASGAVGDLLDSILIVPASTSPGAVTVTDGNGSAITVFAGGASSVSNLIPFSVPWGAKAVNATTPGWKITTGAGVSVVAFGNFT